MRLQQLGGHGQQAAIAFEQDAKARLHAAFLGATGAQAGLAIAEVIEIAGQLALKELAGIGAADGENALVGQGAEKSGISHGSSQGKKSGEHHKVAPLKWVVHKGWVVTDQSRLFWRPSDCILALYLRSAPWSKMLN
ncbi:hypothetical protein EMIT0324P_10395 [Pseudomonas chlororaphis]